MRTEGPVVPEPTDTPPVWVRFARSGLFDEVWYSALTGRSFPHRRAAARHFWEFGMARLLSPNPFLFPGFLPDRVREQTYRRGDLVRLMGYLRSQAAHPRTLSPLYQGSRGQIAVAPGLPGGPLGVLLGGDPDTVLPVPADHLGPAPRLGEAREALIAYAHALHRDQEWVPTPPSPTRGLVSLVLPLGTDPAPTVSAVRSALAHAVRGSEHPLEILVLDPGREWHVGAEVLSWFLTDDRVRLSRHPGLDQVGLLRAGVRLASGEYVALAQQAVDSRTPWLAACLRALNGAAAPIAPGQAAGDVAHSASPIVLGADDTVWEYGGPGPGGTGPLIGHPVEDLAALPEFRGNRRHNLVTVSRHPNFLDSTPRRGLSRWSRGRHHRWPAEAVVSLTDRTAGPPPGGRRTAPGPAAPARPRDGTGLRWGIANPAPPGLRGDLWGDTPLAEGLAAALRRCGESAVVHRRLEDDPDDPDDPPALPPRQLRDLDDVQLTLRGLYRVAPSPGRLNVLWVYSHPEDVTADELRDFDLVLAASASWARRTTAETGVRVHTLLQAVDTARLPGPEVVAGTDPRPVFVGSTHPGRPRPLIEQALGLRIPLVLHGPGWAARLGPDERAAGAVAVTDVAPVEATEVYRRHGLVLADHWADMAREGFVANRLFDAVAAGARVVCDPVPGLEGGAETLEHLFGGAVQVAADPDRLRDLLGAPDAHFPDPAATARIAARVAAEHSYDARARSLVEAVRDLLRARGSDPRSPDARPGTPAY